jgi:hypothetical protein
MYPQKTPLPDPAQTACEIRNPYLKTACAKRRPNQGYGLLVAADIQELQLGPAQKGNSNLKSRRVAPFCPHYGKALHSGFVYWGRAHIVLFTR